MEYDVLIVGGGPAGLTAGLYAVRSGAKTGIITKDIGGTANSILKLENWPGFKGKGSELMNEFYNHVKEYDKVDFIMGEVKEISKEKSFLVKCKEKEFKGKSIIIATGTNRKRLGIKGEKKFEGKGVSYCITCDAFFFKDKDVAIIGGSDCAAVSALGLSDNARKVYVFYRGEELDCENSNSEKLKEKGNVEIIYNSVPIEVSGDKNVEKIKVNEEGEKKEYDVEGVFIETDSTPLSEFVKDIDIKTDKKSYIKINQNMETSVEGIFAAGDITNQKLKQVVVASGQGAIAGKNAYNYSKKQ